MGFIRIEFDEEDVKIHAEGSTVDMVMAISEGMKLDAAFATVVRSAVDVFEESIMGDINDMTCPN